MMPYLLSDWRGRIQVAVGEYRAAREALNRLKTQVAADAIVVRGSIAKDLPATDLNLEGTYIIRAFAVFDAALRSYDRFHFGDPERKTDVSRMINQLGALKKVRPPIREAVHRARKVRHYWAHELDEDPGSMSIDRVRGALQAFLNYFPKRWQ